MERLMQQPQPSVMTSQQHFAMVPTAVIERSTFDRSHGWKGTFDAGYLVPVLVDEMLPGDTFSCNASIFARLATPKFPYMDNAFLDSFFFFVPNRLLWKHWVNLMGEKPNPSDTTVYTVPQIDSGGAWTVGAGDLLNYMGVPQGVGGLHLNAWWTRAYNLIWNEWFRDQNLQDPVVVDTDDGPDDHTDYVLLRRGKRKDYFTGALPWPLKGDPVPLPLGTTAPVVFPSPAGVISGEVFGDNSGDLGRMQVASSSSKTLFSANTGGSTLEDASLYGTATMPIDAYTDLSGATAATINQLRQAFQMQVMLERDARGGTRYIESIFAHFGVRSPDFRLQRPELLGVGETPINVNPVAQTSAPASGAPLGQLAGFGTVSATHGHGFTYSATEHGVIIGLVSVRADLNYQYGLNRMWSRQTRFDFYYPSLAHLGEQAILKQELYAIGASQDTETWGYQERYAEYRYKPSLITGEFNSRFAQPLDSWHLALKHTSLPTLSGGYIEEDPPFDRVIAITDEPHFKCDIFFQYRCARPMPVYAVPGLIDHF